MDPETEREFKHVREALKRIEKTTMELHEVIYKNGLSMEVHDNTKFRKSFKKWMFAIWTSIIGIVSYLIKDVLTK